MLVGYNTNVPYKGKLYHVQTEDNGIKNPFIITLLYYKGTILASKKSSYAELISVPDYREKVRELMKEQHKAMMKELIRGEYGGDAAEAPADQQKEKTAEKAAATQEEQQRAQNAGEKQQISKSLDDVLLDYIIRGGK